jgi:serine protease Do
MLGTQTAAVERDLVDLTDLLRTVTVAVQDGRAGAGSGVVWSADGAIVTNAHVVHGAQPQVVLSDGRRFGARIVRRDARRDLALLQIDADGLTAAEPRREPALRPGEVLVALGHPLGVPNALTLGIAHAAVRGVDERFVQADLRLAPGNSGGPLADVAGRIVGINSMVVDGGLALAVPVATVEDFVGAAAAPGPLGVVLAAARLADGTPVAVVTAVAPGSRAERAGILIGDTIAARDVPRLRLASSLAVRRGGTPIGVTLPREPASARAA